jgi:hypothetical protein
VYEFQTALNTRAAGERTNISGLPATYAITRTAIGGSMPPEHIATRHDIVGVIGTLNDHDIDADHFVGLAQMRIGESLTSAGAANGFRYTIERES